MQSGLWSTLFIHYRSHVPAKLMFIITTRDTAVFIIGCHQIAATDSSAVFVVITRDKGSLIFILSIRAA
jgi:hypothetical protein